MWTIKLSKLVSELKSHHIYFKMCALVNLKVLLIWSDLPLHSPVSWNRQKIIGFQQEEFFLITILAKGSILDVWQGSKNINEYSCKITCKEITDDNWKAQKQRGALAREGLCVVCTFTPSLHSVSSDFSSTKFFFIFFITFYHSFYRYCHCQE